MCLPPQCRGVVAWHGGAIRQSKPTRSRHTALMNLFPKFRRMRRDTIITGCCSTYSAGAALLFRGENFAHQIRSDLSSPGTQKSVSDLTSLRNNVGISAIFLAANSSCTTENSHTNLSYCILTCTHHFVVEPTKSIFAERISYLL